MDDAVPKMGEDVEETAGGAADVVFASNKDPDVVEVAAVDAAETWLPLPKMPPAVVETPAPPKMDPDLAVDVGWLPPPKIDDEAVVADPPKTELVGGLLVPKIDPVLETVAVVVVAACGAAAKVGSAVEVPNVEDVDGVDKLVVDGDLKMVDETVAEAAFVAMVVLAA